MSRVACFVHGNGRGHATRSAAVMRALERKGHEVLAFAPTSVHDVFGSRAGSLEPIPLTRLTPMALPRIAREVGRLRSRLDGKVDAIVTDSEPIGLFVARSLGVPSVALGHGLVFAVAEFGAEAPRWALRRERLKNWPYVALATAQVAVHFAPANPTKESARLARPDAPSFEGVERHASAELPSDPFILAYFHRFDGASLVRELVRRGERVVVFTTEPHLYPEGVVTLSPDPLGFRAAELRAKAVVGSAGSNLLSECIALQKPLLALHPVNHSEQVLNVAVGRAAGVLVGGRADEAPSLLVDRLLAFSASYVPRAPSWAGMPLASDVVVETIERFTQV